VLTSQELIPNSSIRCAQADRDVTYFGLHDPKSRRGIDALEQVQGVVNHRGRFMHAVLL